MKDKIFEWCGRNRQKIGYVGGACGVLAGMGY